MDFYNKILEFNNIERLNEFLEIMNLSIISKHINFTNKIRKLIGMSYTEVIVVSNNIATYVIKYERLNNQINIKEVGIL